MHSTFTVVAGVGSPLCDERSHAMTGPDKKDETESDVAADPHTAGSRAGGSGEDASYVGRTAADDSLDTEESGAEARAKRG